MTGPRDPESPVGQREVLSHLVISQQYEDGTIYQVSFRRGSQFGIERACLSVIDPADLSRAVWSSVHSPWDLEEYEDDNLYLTLWVAND